MEIYLTPEQALYGVAFALLVCIVAALHDSGEKQRRNEQMRHRNWQMQQTMLHLNRESESPNGFNIFLVFVTVITFLFTLAILFSL